MATPPDFVPTKLHTDYAEMSGRRVFSKKMLGDAGALTTGKSDWVQLVAPQSMVFHAFPNGSHTGAFGSFQAEIQGTNKLDDTEPVTDTDYVVIGTLNAGAPSSVINAPWRYVRIMVTNVAGGGVAMQVGLNGFAA